MPEADPTLHARAQSAHPLVAIATPVYNGGKYLTENMASVQAQTYPNLVHVLVDNASTDDTAAIIEGFKGGRIPLLVSRNPETIPIGPNWCAAVANVPAEAKYFSILCADDTLAANAIERMVAVAESDPEVELVGCVTRRAGVINPSDLPPERSVFDGKTIASQFLNKQANDIPHMYGLFRRRAEDLEGGFFDTSLYMMDTDACLRALARGKFGYVHEPVVNIRIHPDQFTVKILETKHSVFEPLIEIERWAKLVMSPHEAAKCRERHLKVIYRFLLYWQATGERELVQRHLKLLAEHDALPTFADYRRAVLEWPLREVSKRLRQRRVRRATEALGFGPSHFPANDVLPRLLNVKWPR